MPDEDIRKEIGKIQALMKTFQAEVDVVEVSIRKIKDRAAESENLVGVNHRIKVMFKHVIDLDLIKGQIYRKCVDLVNKRTPSDRYNMQRLLIGHIEEMVTNERRLMTSLRPLMGVSETPFRLKFKRTG